MEGFIVSKKLLMCFTLSILLLMVIVHAKMHDAHNPYCRLNENNVNLDASTINHFYRNGCRMDCSIFCHKVSNTCKIRNKCKCTISILKKWNICNIMVVKHDLIDCEK